MAPANATPKARVLVLDDDADLRAALAKLLRAEGYHVDALGHADEVETHVRRHLYDVAFLDLRMPERSGIDVLATLRDLDPVIPVLMLTAYGNVDAAVQAFKLGAKDFLTKPIVRERLLPALESALTASLLARQARLLRQRDMTPFATLLGQSAGLADALALARKAARTDHPLLILGETGTGKSRLARAVHAESRRAEGPLVEVVLAGEPIELQKATLFGHTAGAFTGAAKARRGLFQEAAGGTLFFDEVADMAPEIQVALLRAIEDHKIRPLGSDGENSVDVRVLAATNANLPRLVEEGKFRRDLFERLDVFRIELPSLRQRSEDIPLLVAHFAQQAATRQQAIPDFSPEALRALREYPWPGNLRELRNVVERAVVLAEGGIIHVADCRLRASTAGPAALSEQYDQPLRVFDEEAKRRYLCYLLNKYDSYLPRIAEHAGLHVTNLRKLLHKLGLAKDKP